MRIYARIIGLNERFMFDEPTSLKRILHSCPTLAKVFYDVKDDRHWSYRLGYDNPHFRVAISEVDKFRSNPDNYDSLVDNFAFLFRKLLHKSMYEKKDIEIAYYRD